MSTDGTCSTLRFKFDSFIKGSIIVDKQNQPCFVVGIVATAAQNHSKIIYIVTIKRK